MFGFVHTVILAVDTIKGLVNKVKRCRKKSKAKVAPIGSSDNVKLQKSIEGRKLFDCSNTSHIERRVTRKPRLNELIGIE